MLLKIGRSSGLLPVYGLPVFYNSGMQHKQYTELTATGIAPDFNRIPILMALLAPTKFRCKCIGITLIIQNKDNKTEK